MTSFQPEPTTAPPQKRKGCKTIWEGRNGQEVSVEERALQHYQDEGFKGCGNFSMTTNGLLTIIASFHSETSIMTTLWMLLTWDVVYDSDVKGVFETPYQSAPLDIVDDSFYYSRKEKFDLRMDEIRAGKAAEIITRHDTKYRPKNTWAIGVRWDICELQHLIEIVEVCRH
jgi:Fanconi-associated nuclease 1